MLLSLKGFKHGLQKLTIQGLKVSTYELFLINSYLRPHFCLSVHWYMLTWGGGNGSAGGAIAQTTFGSLLNMLPLATPTFLV